MGEFREMGFTQKVMSVCWQSQDRSLCHQSFARNPFLHVLKGLERDWGEEVKNKERTKKAHLSGHLSFKKFSFIPKMNSWDCSIFSPKHRQELHPAFPKTHIWASRRGQRQKSTPQLLAPPAQLLFVVTIKQLQSTHRA